MLPWIALAAGILQNRRAKKDALRSAREDALIGHAESLGAPMAEARALQRRREINDTPDINPAQLISAIGSSVEQDSVDDRLAKEMARRGLMRGYQPF